MAFNTYAQYKKSRAQGNAPGKTLSEAQWKKRKQVDPTKPFTQKQINDLATKAGKAAIQPELDSFGVQSERSRSDYNAQISAERGANTAVMAELDRISPQIQAGYQQGAATLGSLGAGFSGALETQAQGQADEFGALMAQFGAPEGAIDSVQGQVNPEGLGNALYGKETYFPAAGMAREGAAFGALADLQEGYQAAQSRNRITQLGNERVGVEEELRDKETALHARVPGEIAKSRESLRATEIQKAALRIQERELNQEIKGAKAEAANAPETTYMARNPVTGKMVRLSQDKEFNAKGQIVSIKVATPGSGNKKPKPVRIKEAKASAQSALSDFWDDGLPQYKESIVDGVVTKVHIPQTGWTEKQWVNKIMAEVGEKLRESGMSENQINAWIRNMLKLQFGVKTKSLGEGRYGSYGSTEAINIPVGQPPRTSGGAATGGGSGANRDYTGP